MRKLYFKRFYVYFGTTTSCIRHEKVRDLHLRCHLMRSRWFNFLILLQCSICFSHRKNNDKKVTTYLLYIFYVYMYMYIYIHILVSAIKFEVTRSLTKYVWGLNSSTNYAPLPGPNFSGSWDFWKIKEERGWRFSSKNRCVIYIWWVHLGNGGYTLFFFCNDVWIK